MSRISLLGKLVCNMDSFDMEFVLREEYMSDIERCSWVESIPDSAGCYHLWVNVAQEDIDSGLVVPLV